MTYQQSYRLFNCCLIIGLGIIVLNYFLEIWWLFLVGFSLMVGGTKQVYHCCHCPHCQGVLDVRQGKVPHCHHCGGELTW